MAWRGPDEPGEFPTLGWSALDWMAEWLVVPDGVLAGEPLLLTPEQAQFVLAFYRLDPRSCRRVVRRGVLSRAKGWGKSPIMAALSCFEAIGPAYPDGWDASGEPVGRSWESTGFKPLVEILGVSEDGTANTWTPLLDMIREGPLVDMPGVEALETFVNVPRGRIMARTSAALSREGFRPIFDVLDQTESWTVTNGGKRLAATVRRNLTKTGGTSIETPNSFRPGFDSVAEDSWRAWELQREGRLRIGEGILFDHREAPPETEIDDRESMLAGLRWAYGCSADAPCALAEAGHHGKHPRGWADLSRVLADFWDPDTDPADGRMYFLNQITSASDAWVSQQEWLACGPRRDEPGRVVDGREPVVLGFDGSRARSSKITRTLADGSKRSSRRPVKADATALVGCTVKDGHLFQVGVWEEPDGATDWEVPVGEVVAEVRDAFTRWNVVGFYADPAKWESYVADWEAAYGKRLKAKASAKHPVEWWMTGGRSGLISKAVKSLHTAIVEGEVTHDGAATLTRHVLAARNKRRGDTVQIGKEHPDSPRKIDAAVAAVLAWQARNDALALGIGQQPRRQPARRIR